MKELYSLAGVVAGAFMKHFRRDHEHITGVCAGGDAGCCGEAQGAAEDDNGLEVVMHMSAEVAWLAGVADPGEHPEGWIEDAFVSGGDDFAHGPSLYGVYHGM